MQIHHRLLAHQHGRPKVGPAGIQDVHKLERRRLDPTVRAHGREPAVPVPEMQRVRLAEKRDAVPRVTIDHHDLEVGCEHAEGATPLEPDAGIVVDGVQVIPYIIVYLMICSQLVPQTPWEGRN